jgi:hypothetical protein
MHTKQNIIDVLKSTEGPAFTLQEARTGNFRLQLAPAEMKTLKTEEKWRAFLDVATALREKGIECTIRDAFKGNDGNWINYPTLWVNQPEQAARASSQVDIEKAIAAGIAAGLAQAKAQEAKPEVKPEVKPETTPEQEF